MNSFYWPLQRLKREWRYGELRVLVTAVAVAVMAITSVGFFTDRVDSAITKRSAEVMAADLVVPTSINADHMHFAQLRLDYALASKGLIEASEASACPAAAAGGAAAGNHALHAAPLRDERTNALSDHFPLLVTF